jgi:thiamine biosynthesis lipoprotein
MGTVFVFQIADDIGETEATRLCEAASEVLADADERFSLYKPDSEISKLNDSRLAWGDASRMQQSIKKQTEDWKAKTSGFFDAVSPTGVYDPSGLVKSWAARNAAGYLEANGIRDFTLNAGGDIYLGPELTPGILFRVGLSNLKSISAADAAVNMILDLAGSDFSAVATSGSSERGEHIWRTDQKADFLQVTVVGKDLVTADIWATALISGGQEAFELFASQVPATELVALAICHDGSIRATAGFSSLLAAI